MNFSRLSRVVLKTAKTGRISDSLNLCLAAYALNAEPRYVRSRPFHIYLEPTTRCNLQCRMCSQVVPGRPKLDLSFERFLTLLRHFPYLQDLQLQGAGEPLLNPDIFKMIEYANSKNIRVGLFTNATLIDPGAAQKISGSGLNWINLSLDAADPGIYGIIRKGAGYEEVLGNIKVLMAANRKKGPLVSIWFTAMKMNILELPAVIRLAKDLGVRKVVAQGVHFWGSDHLRRDLKEDSLFRDIALTKEVFIRAASEARRLGVRLDFRPRYFQKTGKKVCKWPWLSCFITAEGFVTPCCVQGSDPAMLNFGNIFDKDFEEIWNSRLYQDFRSGLRYGHREHICRDCPGYYYT